MQSKIFKPKILRRERVSNMLSEIFETSVVFVSAPIGYGKTTTVREFLNENNEVKNIWFSINQIDDNKIMIWEKLCNKICETNYKLGKCLSELGFPKNDIDFVKMKKNIINKKMCGKLILVIDNYGQAIDIYFRNILKYIMLENIPDIHVVLISKESMKEEYIELELKQKCIMISQDDIKFTIEETAEFFKQNKLKLNSSEIEKIYSDTLGWIAATYYLVVYYEKENYFNGMSKAEEIIRYAVYNKLDEDTKGVLLKLVPIKEFTLQEMVDITNIKNTSGIIINLINNNCFIQYNFKTKKYYFHPILREVLLKELLSEYSKSEEVYDKCAKWYLSNSKYIEAIECYHKNRNFSSILKIFEEIKPVGYMHASPEFIYRLFCDIPLEIKLENPIAYISLIYFYIINIDFETGKRILYETKEYYEQDDELSNKESIIDEIKLIECCLCFEGINENVEQFIYSCKSLSENKSNILNEEIPFVFGTPNLTYVYHNKQGYLHKNVKEIIKAITHIKNVVGNFGYGLEYLIEGEYYFEIGSLEKAKILAYKALHKAKIDNSMNIIICAYFLIMRLDLSFNNINELNKHLCELKDEEKNFKNRTNFGQACIVKSYVYGLMNDFENMNKYIKEYEKLDLRKLPQIKSTNYAVNAIECIINQDFIKLEVYVEELAMINLKYKNIFISIYTYIFDSIVKDQLYQNFRMAEEALINAINLSKCDNIIMPFVEFYQYILKTIKAIKNKDEYVYLLIYECEKRKEMFEKKLKEEDEIIKITARELEVMRFVEAGYSQVEISERLHIALTTVKKHMSSVYSKTNAKNKTIAIKILKEKKII